MENQKHKSKNILVGIDGSIGSAVNCYLLKKQNFKCFGVNFYLEDKELGAFSRFFEINQKNVESIAQKLDVSIKKVDVSKEFKDQFVDKLVASLIAGKFFSTEYYFEQFLIRQTYLLKDQFSASLFSLPLKAKILENQKYQNFDIFEGNQNSSDESCFLAGLDDEILASLTLSGADLRDQEMDKLFTLIGLSNVDFKSKIKIPNLIELFSDKEFTSYLTANIPDTLFKRGSIKDNQTNNIIGEHAGLARYCYGLNNYINLNKVDSQSDVAKSVVKLSPRENLIVVDNLNLNPQSSNIVFVKKLKLNKGVDFNLPLDAFIKLNAASSLIKVELYFKTNNTAVIKFETPFVGPIKVGQIIYLYSSKNQKAKLLGCSEVVKCGDLVNSTFVESPNGLVEKSYIAKNENSKNAKKINYF